MTETGADLIAFLDARLDEDQAAAWAIHDVSKCDALLYEEDMATAAARTPDCDCGHPARALREVAAKRAILAAYERAPDWSGGEDVRHLAAIYSGHPDYDPAICAGDAC